MKIPYLSIVIPAHNEEIRLPLAFKKIEDFIKKQKFSYEVIVVENGSRDRTVDITKEFIKSHPHTRLISVETRGKGLAVKAGMLAAVGERRFICDADLSMPIDEIAKFFKAIDNGFDVVIGSREGKDAKRIGEPFHRHLMGRVLNFIIKAIALQGVEDTQCGFKMFTKKAAEDLFSVQKMTGIGFDIELIYIAKRRGYRICEVPIVWYFDADSRMRLVQDSLKILLEIWQIKQNWRKGIYAKIN